MSLFKRRPTKPPTRLFFATDLHGSETAFRKFIIAARFYEAQVLILGGDVAGKLLVPIVRRDGAYRGWLMGRPQELATEAERTAFQDRLHQLGYYTVVLDADEFADLQADPGQIERTYLAAARARLASWLALAEERLRGSAVRCFVTGGNDDHPEVLAVLDEAAGEHVVPCEEQALPLDADHTLVSLGYSNPTPWRTPRELSEAGLAERIECALKDVPDLRRCIFNFHCPPKDSSLDTCALLDDSTDPTRMIR
jgi:Icc-related predicted phosphoesterase